MVIFFVDIILMMNVMIALYVAGACIMTVKIVFMLLLSVNVAKFSVLCLTVAVAFRLLVRKGSDFVNRVLLSSNSEEWSTPQDLFDQLDLEFHFTVDVCSSHDNAKCPKHYTKDDDGLLQDWSGDVVWCNPPYGRQMTKWIRKCSEHGKKGGIAVMLIPARTDTKAFHEYIYNKSEIRFIKGRLKFSGAVYNAPFPSMIVIFRG